MSEEWNEEEMGFDEADWDKKQAEAGGGGRAPRGRTVGSGYCCRPPHLTLDIPATPLFKDSQGGNIIPQIPLFKVLDKYNGQNWTVLQFFSFCFPAASRGRYLIFHLARFTKNNFYVEKNPTIVNFPVKNLELKDCDHLEDKVRDTLIKTVPELLATKYNLLANICHDSPPGQGKEGQTDPLSAGCYRAHVQNKATEQWYEVQDLHVQETMPQLIGLSESYIIIYEKKRSV
eukprot:jgi/Undpi1/4571/HiC_scaffold_18.g07925.m1